MQIFIDTELTTLFLLLAMDMILTVGWTTGSSKNHGELGEYLEAKRNKSKLFIYKIISQRMFMFIKFVKLGRGRVYQAEERNWTLRNWNSFPKLSYL